MTNSSYLETIKAFDGEIFHIEYHQKRYEGVLKSLGILKPKILSDYIYPPQKGLYRCRVIYTHSELSVTYHEYKKRDIKSLKVVYDDTINYSLKSTNRDSLDKLYERREEHDDVLIVKNSLLTDTTIANIALLLDGIWYTPKEPLLKGTTRERLLKSYRIVEKDIHIDELHKYSHIALMNAMIDFDIIRIDNIRNVIC